MTQELEREIERYHKVGFVPILDARQRGIIGSIPKHRLDNEHENIYDDIEIDDKKQLDFWQLEESACSKA